MNRKRIDPDIKQILIDKYLTGKYSITQLSKIFNISVYKIIRDFREENIFIENKAILPKITEELGREIIKEYETDNNNISKLSKIYNISVSVISKYLKKNGINVINKQNECNFNQNIFDNIDNEEKSYWLGFIFADGCITTNRYSFELSLAIKDENHLNRFNEFMEYKGNNVKRRISKYNGKELISCRWSVVNKHLWETLNNLGCIPKKSTKLVFPENLPIEYIPSFIRGYFDGDGCITGTTKSINATILGTEPFLNGIINFFKRLDPNFKYSILTDRRMEMTKVLRIQKKSLMLFFNTIYKNNTICLNRKYNKFIDLLNLAVSYRDL